VVGFAPRPYQIAAPSTPEEARQEVLDKATTPEGIFRAEVERIVKDARQAERKAAEQRPGPLRNPLRSPYTRDSRALDRGRLARVGIIIQG
jgi:hypothetical protein